MENNGFAEQMAMMQQIGFLPQLSKLLSFCAGFSPQVPFLQTSSTWIVSSQIIYLGSNPTTEAGIYVAKYGYFILIPVDPAKIEKIFRDGQNDREKIDDLVKYVIPTLRKIWKKDKKIPVLQTELSQMSRK